MATNPTAAGNANGNGTPFRVTLRDLPLPARLVLTVFLLAVGLGYFAALAQLHFQNATPGEPLPTPDDVVEIFSGVTNWSGKAPAPPKPVSKLEKLIMAPENLPHNGSGTMAFAFFTKELHTLMEKDPVAGEKKHQLREGERLALQAWINAPEEERKETYTSDAFPLPAALADHPITKDFVEDGKVKVKSIIIERCNKCHAEEGGLGKKKLADNYADFEDVLVVPTPGKTSRQMSLVQLTQTTHLHLLSFSVLWTLTGLTFAFSSYWKWLRCVVAPLALVAQVADVSCWWLARLDGVGPYFALAIIGTGTAVALGLALQIVLSLLDMYRMPGRIVLVLLFGGAIGAGVFLEPHVAAYLNQEKAPPPTAPAK